ncbi:hypothetical protein PoB_007523400 [Plakobranchus ocellatus]|uniref:Uncharacterized protein n=1 Tax=Plakobranchus ocellatus TaxID=259542 RepID=A0AAV4DWY9_9GAST|nr:hypothetical protein PoB_007523400 [Plakobranchus ocellatus]
MRPVDHAIVLNIPAKDHNTISFKWWWAVHPYFISFLHLSISSLMLSSIHPSAYRGISPCCDFTLRRACFFTSHISTLTVPAQPHTGDWKTHAVRARATPPHLRARMPIGQAVNRSASHSPPQTN